MFRERCPLCLSQAECSLVLAWSLFIGVLLEGLMVPAVAAHVWQNAVQLCVPVLVEHQEPRHLIQHVQGALLYA